MSCNKKQILIDYINGNNENKVDSTSNCSFFAILQPFIHTHLDTHHSIEHEGFHIASAYEDISHHVSHMDEETLSSIPHASSMISVALGVKKDIDPTLAISAITFVLLFLCFIVSLLSISKYFPPILLVPAKSLKRQVSTPRAPPQF